MGHTISKENNLKVETAVTYVLPFYVLDLDFNFPSLWLMIYIYCHIYIANATCLKKAVKKYIFAEL